jgi:hypothetical protein
LTRGVIRSFNSSIFTNLWNFRKAQLVWHPSILAYFGDFGELWKLHCKHKSGDSTAFSTVVSLVVAEHRNLCKGFKQQCSQRRGC